MPANLGRCVIRFAICLLFLVAGFPGNALAQAIDPPQKYQVPYCTSSSFPATCTKTITIYNNYDYPIYPVIQGTLEQGPILLDLVEVE